jgi:hypothetical protein
LQKAQAAQQPEQVADQQQRQHFDKGVAPVGQGFEEMGGQRENGRAHNHQHCPPAKSGKNVRKWHS